jgi:Protein of unknown function (DUF1176)
VPDSHAPAACFTYKQASLPRRYVLALAVCVLACSGAMAADVPGANTSTAARLTAKAVVFSHKDWELACDNTRTCRAVGYQHDNDALSLALLLTREAGVATPVRAQLMLGSYDNATPPMPSSLNVLLNGRVLGAILVDKNSGIGELNAMQTDAVLLALPKAADVQFVSGRNRWKLSGDGAAAVLLKMDEAQGRLGTATALVKKGNASDDGVLPKLPVPVVQMGPIIASKPVDKSLATALKPLLISGKDDCFLLKEADPKVTATEQLQLWRLNATKVLVSTRCWSAAYNSGDGYWLVNDKPPYQPQLVSDSGSDYGRGIISASHKGRGLGDCWSSNEWVWNGNGFTHSSESTTGMCKLVAGGGAWELPTIVSHVIPAAK